MLQQFIPTLGGGSFFFFLQVQNGTQLENTDTAALSLVDDLQRYSKPLPLYKNQYFQRWKGAVPISMR